MAGELFGWAAGQRLAEQDQQAMMLNALTAQKDVEALKSAPILRRLRSAEAGAAEFKLNRDERVAAAERLAPIVSGEAAAGMDPAEVALHNAYSTINTLSQQGLTMEAGKTLQMVGQIEAHRATARNQATEQKVRLLDAEKKATEIAAEEVARATSQEGLEAANRNYRFRTGRVSPYEGQTWSPALMQQIDKNILTAKQRIDTDRQRAVEAIQAATLRERLRHDSVSEAISWDKAKTYKQAVDTRAKAAGIKAEKSMSSTDRLSILALVKTRYPTLTDAQEQLAAAAGVDSEAKRLVRLNPALKMDTARQQAITNLGPMFNVPEQSGLSKYNPLSAAPQTHFLGGGDTPETALPLPTDKSKLMVGRYYTYKGKTYPALGNGMLGDPVEVGGTALEDLRPPED